jgi:MerR family transcriptional regulator, copper efflux regulator
VNIGDAAKLTGLSAKMIRYYESVGLVCGIQRTTAGYRDFDDSDLALLLFISWARDIAMPVRRVAQLLHAIAHGEDVRPILSAHAEDIRQEIDDLTDKHGVVRRLCDGWSSTLTVDHLATIQSKACSARQRLAWSAPIAPGRSERGSEGAGLDAGQRTLDLPIGGNPTSGQTLNEGSGRYGFDSCASART